MIADIPRRAFLRAAAAATALPAFPHAARALDYPTRPVHWIIGYTHRGTHQGAWLTEHLGQPFIIGNRPGAGGNIAAEIFIRSPADGTTPEAYAVLEARRATTIPSLPGESVAQSPPHVSLRCQ